MQESKGPAYWTVQASKGTARFAAFVLLLGGPVLFSLIGKPTEAAVCIVAACLALVFIDLDRYESFKGGGFEAKLREVKAKVDAMQEAQTEPVAEPRKVLPPLQGPKTKGEFRDADRVFRNAMRLLQAIGESKFTWRYARGLRQETSLSPAEVQEALSFLTKWNLIRESEGGDGQPIYAITEHGRSFRDDDGTYGPPF